MAELTEKEKEEIAERLRNIQPPKVTQSKQRPKKSEKNTDLQPGDNTLYNQHALQIMSLNKINTNDAEEVHQRGMEYFAICTNNDMKPSVAGFSLALGVSRSTLMAWLNGERQKPSEVIDAISNFMAVLNMQMEDYMQNGKINPVSGIFLMKNNYAYRDQQEMVVSTNRMEESTPESLIEESNMLSDDLS